MKSLYFILGFILVFFSIENPSAQTNNTNTLVICSQNLKNFSSPDIHEINIYGEDSKSLKKRAGMLAERFAKNYCDIIALQEIAGDKDLEAIESASYLKALLERKTNKQYLSEIGRTNGSNTSLGYIYNKSIKDAEVKLFDNIDLPKLSKNQRPRYFLRLPLIFQFTLPNREKFVLINIHFKSRHNSASDPAKLSWEGYRMEMASAVAASVRKEIANGKHVMVLGDRNASRGDASTMILEGSLNIGDFQFEKSCQVSKEGMALCSKDQGTENKNNLISLIEADTDTRNLSGTFNYKNKILWLDDILVNRSSLKYFEDRKEVGRTSPKDLSAGIEYSPKGASDHAMVYGVINL